MKIQKMMMWAGTVSCFFVFFLLNQGCGNLQDCLDQNDCSGDQVCGSGVCQSNRALKVASKADMEALCIANCGWGNRCGEGSKKDCSLLCKGSTAVDGYPNYPLRVAFVKEVTACFQSLSCKERDDICGERGLLAVNKNYVTSSYSTLCYQKYQACGAKEGGTPTKEPTEPENMSDDICKIGNALISTAQQKAKKCLELPCSKVTRCFVSIGK